MRGKLAIKKEREIGEHGVETERESEARLATD